MQLYPVAGSKIFIGGPVAGKSVVTMADFAGRVWKEIDGWTSAGSLGDTQEIISQSVINQGRVRKMKGTSDAGTMENTFIPMPADEGQAAFRQAIPDGRPYAFKIEWGAGVLPQGAVTFTATAKTVNWNSHALPAGTPISFTTAGALPAGVVAGEIYYILASNMSLNSFEIASTPTGAALTFATAGTGVHTAAPQPLGQTDLFFGFAASGSRQGGEANAAQLRSYSIAVDSNILEV